jgi:alkylation response protein AidB-like acyl-CoA dehydrogenase
VEAEVNRLTSLRARDMQIHGTPGPEGSVAKLAFAELNQRTYTECVSLMGAGGMLHDNGYEMSRPDTAALTTGSVRYLFLRSRANSIEGGTSEVLRNVLAERVLGLPREPSGATR